MGTWTRPGKTQRRETWHRGLRWKQQEWQMSQQQGESARGAAFHQIRESLWQTLRRIDGVEINYSAIYCKELLSDDKHSKLSYVIVSTWPRHRFSAGVDTFIYQVKTRVHQYGVTKCAFKCLHQFIRPLPQFVSSYLILS